ncbi:PEP-CTERM sorting domain-containing protein [Verrucomicrobiaceae bacterium 227]
MKLTTTAKLVTAIAGLSLTANSAHASIIIFDGITGANNTELPTTLGSNLTSDVAGATVINGATPDIDLEWAGSNGGWDLYAGGTYWAALETATGRIGQLEYPTTQTPMTITFAVADGQALQLNSVDIGMATDKTDTYYFDITISEVGGGEVFNFLTAAMDGDGSSGVETLTVDFNFTGTPGTDYVLAFNDVDSLGNDTISNNGGAIDNLSFNQVIPEPSSSALLGLGGLALLFRRRK